MMQKKRKTTTIVDVSELAGVSRSCAAYILSGNTRYSFRESTVRAVMTAAAQLHYISNPMASSLRSQKNNIIIGILGRVCRYPDIEVLTQLKQEFHKRGYYLVIQFMIDITDAERIDFFQKIYRWAAGLVILDIGILPKSAYYQQMLQLLSQAPPSISTLGYITGSSVDYIMVDWGKNSYMILDYFAQKKCKKIVYCSYRIPSSEKYLTAAAKERGMSLQIWYHDFPMDASTQDVNFFELGYAVGQHLLTHWDERPDAIYCNSDESACAIQSLLQNAGVKIPDDMAIVSGGDSNCQKWVNPQLPIFRHDFHEIAEVCATYLTERIQQGETTVGTGKCVKEISQKFYLAPKTAKPSRRRLKMCTLYQAEAQAGDPREEK